MSSLIKQQFQRTRQTLSETLEGITNDVAQAIPKGFNNNIHWQVGHILTAGELFMFFGNEQLPEHYQKLFGYGSKPADWSNDIPTLSTLLEQLNVQLERINKIPDESFQKKLREPVLGNETVGELAAMGAFHEAMHLGQIQSMKRLIEGQNE